MKKQISFSTRRKQCANKKRVAIVREGFGREGFGREGFGREGFGREGFGREGFGRKLDQPSSSYVITNCIPVPIQKMITNHTSLECRIKSCICIGARIRMELNKHRVRHGLDWRSWSSVAICSEKW